MAKRVRSPNYPAISLSDAVEKLAKLRGAIHTHAAPRDVVLKGMGYGSANGASLGALAALNKYGLIQRKGSDFRITERGTMYLFPQDREERMKAVQDAAAEPKIFAELNEQFPGGTASDELIRSFLLRNGFTPSAASIALLSYRETQALVERVCGQYGAKLDESDEEPASMEHQQSTTPASAQLGSPESVVEPVPSEAPFEVTITDKIKGSFNFNNQEDVEDLISVLNAIKTRLPRKAEQRNEQDNFETAPVD